MAADLSIEEVRALQAVAALHPEPRLRFVEDIDNLASTALEALQENARLREALVMCADEADYYDGSSYQRIKERLDRIYSAAHAALNVEGAEQ